jgi:hypothetical protein
MVACTSHRIQIPAYPGPSKLLVPWVFCREHENMCQIMLRTTEPPGSRLSIDVIGEKPLDTSLLGDRSGRLQ